LATEFPHLGFELLLLRLANAQGLLSVEELGSSAEAAGATGGKEAPKLPTDRPAAPPAADGHGRPSVGERRDASGYPSPTTFSRKPAPPPKAMDGLVPRQAGMPQDLQPRPEAGSAKGASAKGDPGLWDAVRRNLEGKKKTVLLGLLSQMRGELQEGEFVITCGHEMMLDRLKEKDKWQPLLTALEEAAGRAVPVRLSVSTEKKSPEPDAVAPGDAGLERKALEEPTVLEILRTFEGSILVKVQPAPPVEVPRNEVAADEDAGEPEIPEPVEEGG
ncbi:MAG TPA: hypothetical protein VF357_09575, partial [Candidatus Deferrimicrobium sp.]